MCLAPLNYKHECAEINVCIITGECDDNDVRLIAGVAPNDGRVEICFNGLWNQICDIGWDVREAVVVCRQLGHDGCKSQFPSNTFTQFLFSPASYPLLAHYSSGGDMQYGADCDCDGTENMLYKCCAYYMDRQCSAAGTVCTGSCLSCHGLFFRL